MRHAIISFLLFATFGSLSARVCVWTGDGLDGKWNTPANWDGNAVPMAGDIVALQNSGSGTLTTENNIEGLSILCLAGYSGGAVRVTGKALSIGVAGAGPFNGQSVTNMSSLLTIDVPVQFTAATTKICYEGNTTFNGAITFGDVATKLTTQHRYSEGAGAPPKGTLTFNASITGTNVTFDVGSSGTNPIYLKAPVNFKSIVGGGSWPGVYFAAAGNKYGSCNTKFNNLYFTAVNAADPEAILKFTADNYDSYQYGTYWIQADQVVYGFESDRWTKGPNQQLHCCNTAGATITARPARNLQAWVRFGDIASRSNLSLVYDPSVDCTQTLHDVSHGMNGTVTVKGGTLRFDLGAKLQSVTKLTVENGTFESDCTNDVAMFSSKLKQVMIGSTGRVRICSDRGVSPFTAGSTLLRVSAGGVLEVGADIEVDFTVAWVGGIPLTNGIYTAANSNWMKGEGRVRVSAATQTTYWSAAVDGPWAGEGHRWVPGVPGAEVPAYMLVEGGDYTVTLAEQPAAFPPSLEFGQEAGDGITTLDVTGIVTPGASAVTVSRNGIVSLASGGSYAQTNGSFKVSAGGELNVSGGTFRFASDVNNTKDFNLESGAKLVATAGTVELPILCADQTAICNLDSNGSEINLSGTATLDFRVSKKRSAPVFCGSVKMSGDATIGFDQPKFESADGHARTNYFIFSERSRALFDESPIVKFGEYYNNGGWLVCDFSSANEFYVQYGTAFGAKGNTRVDVHGSGSLAMDQFELAIGGTRSVTAHEAVFVVRDGGRVRKGITTNYDSNLYGVRVREGGVLRVASGGTMNVGSKDGSTGNTGAWFLVGAGDEGGRVEVTGGKLTHLDRFQMLIGAWGGDGLWLQTAGTTAVTRTEVYVGGATTNVLTGFRCGNTGAAAPKFNNFAADAATGRLQIDGGSFECANDVVFGFDGAGTLAMGPSPVARLIAHDLVFTNAATASGLGRATASFTFGPEGVGCATAQDRLVIADGSRLVVDASALANGGKVWYPLLTGGVVEGAFDPANIALTKPAHTGNRNAEVVRATRGGKTGYWLHVPHGLSLIFL